MSEFDTIAPRVLAQRYRLDRKIAEGGFGVVYRGTQLQLNRPVAVKVISKQMSDSAETRQRFMLEAATLAKVVHANIVTIHDFGQTDDGEVFIVMEYLEGRSLSEALQREGPISFARIVRIGVQIARALRHAHASGVVHRDLKPANVMLVRGADEADRDHAKVLDFGLVKLLDDGVSCDESTSESTTLLGTPRYMSPEQICGEHTDGRADQYSLGCILYHLASGSAPFVGDGKLAVVQAHLTEDAPPLAETGYRRSCPPALEAVITRCLEKAPADRYASMSEVVSALKEVYGGIPIEETGDLTGDFGRERSEITHSGVSVLPQARPARAPAWAMTPLVAGVIGAVAMALFFRARETERATQLALPETSPAHVVRELPATDLKEERAELQPEARARSATSTHERARPARTKRRSSAKTSKPEPSPEAILPDVRAETVHAAPVLPLLEDDVEAIE